jgi:hypothetical protein
MNTRNLSSKLAQLILGAACLVSTASCGGELLRTGRAPVYLVVMNMQASNGQSAATFTSFLLSDVQVLIEETINGATVRVPTIFNDNVQASIRVDAKNQSVETTPINAVTITRYRVNFRRSDGRNTPGVDVPYGFDGAVSTTIDAGDTGTVSFELVRHQAKLEPPLRNLVGLGGLGFISTIAEVTFYGRDQNGNEVIAIGSIDVQFGDFGDE